MSSSLSSASAQASTPDLSQTPWYTLEPTKALELLRSDREAGLSAEEVSQRQSIYGPNEIEEGAGRSAWVILFDQFKNIMLLMLIVVAVVSAVLDVRSQQFPKDAVAIFMIVVLNGILGYLQESRAEKALAALKKLSSPKVRVIRGAQVVEVSSKELVPGDLMLLEAGSQVSADGLLLEAVNLQVRESALTGEAHSVDKDASQQMEEGAPLGDRLNMVFQGTEVVQGRATVLVTATAMETELGRIASMLQGVENEPTPLQKRMSQLGNVLVTGSLVLVTLVVAGGVAVGGWDRFEDLLEVSLSMAVAVVPEGLPAVITVTLAIGTQRMVQRQALIRRLPAVETLGSVTTICSDKTGTLTQNKMVVQRLQAGQQSVRVTGEGYAPQGEFFDAQDQAIASDDQPALQTLLLGSLLCNDALLQHEQDHWVIIGDPTEGALLSLAGKAGFEQEVWKKKLPRVAEVPFSSDRKRMSVVCQREASDQLTIPGTDGATYYVFAKGSPELLMERCDRVLVGDRLEPITDDHRSATLDGNNDMASRGLRVLGFAYRPLTELPAEDAMEQVEESLVWLGLVGMLDAPRPEARDAVERCRQAGIRPVMITGDHRLTAQAIAHDLKIAQPSDRVLEGHELEKMSVEDLESQVDHVSVYARVSPKHKLQIVQALQRRGKFVAMTGDGVNDAPALKQADIGIAMGITGTDVSKEASDMILLDDNFATIVAATEEGRVVYTNIRRFIKYILGSNIGEVLTIAAAPILLPMGGVPLTPLQILWMNLVTDGLPALALAVEPPEPDVMKRPPNSPNESIFARGLGSYMVRIGIIFAILTIALMLWAYNYSNAVTSDLLRPERWKTMVFTTLCIAQMGHAIAVRSNSRLTVEMNPVSNPFVLGAVILTTLLQLSLVYVEPLRNFFGTHYISGLELLVCIGFSSLMFVWIEMEKLAIRLYHRARSSGG